LRVALNDNLLHTNSWTTQHTIRHSLPIWADGGAQNDNSLFLLIIKAAAILVCSAIALPGYAGPSIYPTGTTRYDPAKAYNSYMLFTGGDNIAHLIDLNGNSVHEWQDAGGFSTLIDPSLNAGKIGNVFVTIATIEGG
jgi:hypothetical protein